jgi:hypothetical protein
LVVHTPCAGQCFGRRQLAVHWHCIEAALSPRPNARCMMLASMQLPGRFLFASLDLHPNAAVLPRHQRDYGGKRNARIMLQTEEYQHRRRE